MSGFVDEVQLFLKAGDGASGAKTFRREKGEPFGGPSGGDGGAGGNIVFCVRSDLRTLTHLRYSKVIEAARGNCGGSSRKAGKRGPDTIVLVPPGTQLLQHPSRRLIRDLKLGETWTFLQGGQGGLGNYHFKTSINQAPVFAQPGQEGESASVVLEMKMIADVALVGFPNAGKSSLIRILTDSPSAVGDYPFTTQIPHLGVFLHKHYSLIIADIPGLLPGASKGVGLGTSFLKHISRTASLLFLLDFSKENYVSTLATLLQELAAYQQVSLTQNSGPNLDLLHRPRLVLGTKCDLLDTQTLALKKEDFTRYYPKEKLLLISAHTNWGLDSLKDQILETLPQKNLL